jgi:ribosome-associated toxin RatA of RatAB toxin-antitoxin module
VHGSFCFHPSDKDRSLVSLVLADVEAQEVILAISIPESFRLLTSSIVQAFTRQANNQSFW